MNSHLHVAITDEELSEWADKRADDAGRLARELIASRNGQKVPQDVTKLVIAARVVAFEDQSREAIRALDIASEAFADRVPWDGEPALSPPAVPGEVRAQLDLIKHLAEYTTEKNWDDKRLYIMQAADRALSVPLPEIEGGDKGDAPSNHVLPLDDKTITDLAWKHFGESVFILITREKSPPMIPQETYDVPTLALRQFVDAIRAVPQEPAPRVKGAAPSASIEGETP